MSETPGAPLSERRVGPITVTLHTRSWVWPRLKVALIRTRWPGSWVYRLVLLRWNLRLELAYGPGEGNGNGAAAEPEPPAHPHPDEDPGPGPGTAA